MSELIERDTAHALIKAELDTQITTAKAYPRDITKFIADATMLATIDQETAESCIYALPRKNEKGEQAYIKGESIRLAEIVASAWGNLHAGTRIIANDGKTITAEAVAWDLEKNLKICKETKRSILTKTQKTYSQDMQVVTGNAASSIALRNAILAVIPRALVKRVYEAAVQAAIGDQTKLTQKIQDLFDRFKKMGIDPTKILAYFNKKESIEITVTEVEEMIGIGTAIKEGNLLIDKAFMIETEQSVSKSADLNNRIDDNKSWVDDYDQKN